MTFSRLAVAALAISAGSAIALADFTPGNLVVSSINGTTNAAQSVSLLEFTAVDPNQPAPISTTNMPTAANGANFRFTLSGSATSEGALTRSVDGRYLTIAGYDAALGTASVAGTTSANNPRVIGRIGSDFGIDTTTGLGDAYSGNNIRSVVSTDGTDFWTAGPAVSSIGIRYATLGSSTSTGIAATNSRVANIYSNQLFIGASSNPIYGVATVGTGLPTTTGQTVSALPGFPAASGPSSYDYVFTDATTLWVADDRSVANNGGLQKWLFDGSNWNLAATYNTGLTAGLRGLTGETDASGAATLYAVTADSSANKLVSFTESAGFTTLATSAAGTIFRGVDFAPVVPAPASIALLSIGTVLIARRRRA